MMYDFTFVFQVHDREASVFDLLRPFVDAQAAGMRSQIIVCNDGSTDNTHAHIMQAMPNNAANTVMTMWDAYETELTWRAMRIAEGEIVALLQDDDYYSSMDFADNAKRHFDRLPDLAAVGCKHGLMFDRHFNFSESYGDYRSTDLACHQQPRYVDGFMEVGTVDRSPFIFRRKCYEEVGGIDRGIIQDTWSDHDLCLSFREHGYKIGLVCAVGSFHFQHWKSGSINPGSSVNMHSQTRLGSHAQLRTENRERVYRKHKTLLEAQ